MNWKQIVFTAIITLFVTIISGVLVNWYTINNIDILSKEDLIYDVKPISRFNSDSLNISLYTIVVSNIGNIKSQNISLKLEFDQSIDIIDITSILERTQENIEPLTINEEIAFDIPKLFPTDNFTVSIALKSFIAPPRVILQNDNIIGRPITNVILNNDNKEIFKSKYLVAILISVLALFPVLYLFTGLYRRIFGYDQSLNNTAFLSIHNNQFNLANKLLKREIYKNGGTVSELSNYGLVKFLNGSSQDEYEPFLRMAEFLSQSRKKSNLVLSFNKMIISAKNNEIKGVEENFRTSVEVDRNEFKKWYNYSIIIKQIKAENDSVNSSLISLEKSLFD